jgi:hypothetical protein
VDEPPSARLRHEVIVANSRKLPLIYENQPKAIV